MSPGKVNAANFAKMMRSLQLGGLTCVELAKASGLHRNTIRDYTNALKDAEVIYIEDWKQIGGNRVFVPLFRIGHDDDAPKPKPLTRSQIQARHVARMKRHVEQPIERPAERTVERPAKQPYRPMTKWIEVPKYAKTKAASAA